MDDYNFFRASMPDSRPADYYLGCLNGSVFIDFNDHKDNLICLKRISFDGYGCCTLDDEANPMNETDSQAFKELYKAQDFDQKQLSLIVKRTINNNREHIWNEALTEYGF
ncbi:hypothetical protein [Breznakiella homolactica]|uniref:Uncharacterized protein n=1 Tax=Breznakiella homolactica TaxID=2798577 RepID=A0A7T8BBK8_9SPIR|nr:hypothetical protein [Breznakiella homolactica]QQO10506.1 hypothetical protein JFL75_06220 [Breznakiella homolactica]